MELFAMAETLKTAEVSTAVVFVFFIIGFVLLAILGKLPRFVTKNATLSLDQNDNSVKEMYMLGLEIDEIDRRGRFKLKDKIRHIRLKCSDGTPEDTYDSIQFRAAFELMMAAYENHFARELTSAKANLYIRSKVNAVRDTLPMRMKKYTSDSAIKEYVLEWAEEAAAAAITIAEEKIIIYDQHIMFCSKNSINIISNVRDRNRNYIQALNELISIGFTTGGNVSTLANLIAE